MAFFTLRILSIFFLVVLLGHFTTERILPCNAFAEKKLEDKYIEKDIDGDGKIDQIAFFDIKGKIKRLESDNNKDGLMDRFQYYKDEKLIRVERDTDFNQQIDCLDYLDDGKMETFRFYQNGEIAKQQKDTNLDGLMDSVTFFKDAQPVEQKKIQTLTENLISLRALKTASLLPRIGIPILTAKLIPSANLIKPALSKR